MRPSQVPVDSKKMCMSKYVCNNAVIFFLLLLGVEAKLWTAHGVVEAVLGDFHRYHSVRMGRGNAFYERFFNGVRCDGCCSEATECLQALHEILAINESLCTSVIGPRCLGICAGIIREHAKLRDDPNRVQMDGRLKLKCAPQAHLAPVCSQSYFVHPTMW